MNEVVNEVVHEVGGLVYEVAYEGVHTNVSECSVHFIGIDL